MNAERSEHHLGIHMSAFDAQGHLITCSQISSVPVGDWKTNYISVISHVPIAKVLIYGDYLVVDELGFTADEQTVVRGTRRSETIDRDHKFSSAGSSNKAEIILGRRGDDKIDASGGNDHVRGGWGDDVLRGGKGKDTLIGGRGHDGLFGDGGQDSFLFRHFGSDKLKDFNPSDDTIVLDHARFSAIEPGHLDESQFEVGAAATDADDRILYDSASGKLYYDEDGTGPSGAVQFAKLAAGLSLAAEDFSIA